MSHQLKQTSVFYDGGCPLCRREINHYKKLGEGDSSTDQINWIDISQSQLELEAEGIKYSDAMQLIHVRDESGVHQVGIEGIFTLWEKLPYYRKLASTLRRIPWVPQLMGSVYIIVAKHRMKLTGRL